MSLLGKKYTIKQAKKFHSKRSLHAQRIDEVLEAKKAPSIEYWFKHYNRSDLPEIDMPKQVKKTKKKVRKGSFELRVGTGVTGSGYPIKYLAYVYENGRWVFLPDSHLVKGEVEWDWISRTKRLGTFRGEAPVGTIIRYYSIYRKGGRTDFYMVTEKGLKELEKEEVTEEVTRVENCPVILKKWVLKEVNLEIPVSMYVKGWISDFIEQKWFTETENIEKQIKEYIGHVKEEASRRGKYQVTVAGSDLRIKGETYPIKDKLKGLGFYWIYGNEWCFTLTEKNVEKLPKIEKELKQLGVKISHEDIEKLKKNALKYEILGARRRAIKNLIPTLIPKEYRSEIKKIEDDGEKIKVQFEWLRSEHFKDLSEKLGQQGWQRRGSRFYIPMQQAVKLIGEEKVKTEEEQIIEELKRKFS